MSPPDRPVFNDRYEIHSRIGRGGMADVFLARDRLLDRPVAIKVLFPEYANDPNFVERFRREATAASNLAHPNIVGVYDFGRQGTTYYIVMEYVNGRTLADILKADGTVMPQRAADIASDVAAALGFAHRNGVVHRDVKPANILVSPTGAVKVADFGIARALNSSTEQDLTQAGAVMGTATYFSPEQAQGGVPDPRSDLYSLGIVMYEMVAGRPPFSGENPVAIAYKQVHEAPRALSAVKPDVPRAYEAIVMKLLGKSPVNRYPSAEDLRADLRRYRDGQPVAALAAAGVGATTATTAVRPTVAQTQAVAYQATRAMPQQRTPHPPAALAGVPGLRRLAGPQRLVHRRCRAGHRPPGRRCVPAVPLAQRRLGRRQRDPRRLHQPALRPGRSGGPRRRPHASGRSRGEGRRAGEPGLRPVAAGGADGHQGVHGDPHLQPGAGPGGSAEPRRPGRGRGHRRPHHPRHAGARHHPAGVERRRPAGQIIAQVPPAGQVDITTKVTLTVSSGKGQAQVPNVTGLDQAAAAAQLGQAGFGVSTTQEANEKVDQGKVIRTDPAAGTNLDKGKSVTMVVSSGAPLVDVPSVVGQTESEARNALQAAGFLQATSSVDVPFGSTQAGRVVSQSPASGKAAKGSTVTLTIGKETPAPTTTTTAPRPTTTVAPPTSAATPTSGPGTPTTT